ncbi:MAG: FAD-binding protein [Crocinitomicaceae bacterium]|nr:FAD-binding protein [Crocinitomicaceae bacterium]
MEQNDSGVFKGQIRITPDLVLSDRALIDEVESQLSLENGSITWVNVLRRSIDARKKPVMMHLVVEAGNESNIFARSEYSADYVKFPVLPDNAPSVLVVGSGPAGLYAALELIVQGIKPVVIERGKMVRDRRRDLAKLTKNHIVDPDSNYCFGEGGAGTYSDGKLYTRAKKRGHVMEALVWLVAHGASSDILIDAHPHIGTNKLPKIITEIRSTIIRSGGEVRFGTKLIDFSITSGAISGATLLDVASGVKEEFVTEHIVLATGHSARDIFHLLHSKNLALEAKPFALGVRVEHPQSFINQRQYHGESMLNPQNEERLPAASYSLVCQIDGRGVHSFCMCPGGIIAPCATAQEEIVTNGWSPSKRNNPFANSGMVVQIDREIWEKDGYFGPLAALNYQSAVEKACWKSAGRTQKAPAQMLCDFIKKRPSNPSSIPDCSYHPGLTMVNLHEVLPPVVSESLRKGFLEFDKRIIGFNHPEAVIVAPESRTSSPVKIPRDKETLEHPDAKGLYPCGEGGGYAGGILSAAMDGRRVAQSIVQLLSPKQVE